MYRNCVLLYSKIDTDTFLLRNGIRITAGQNLDNFQTIGNYFCEEDLVAKGLSNCPLPYAFTMKVFYSTGTAYISQLLFFHHRGDIYYRIMINGQWRGWYKHESVG